jgi:hypothetical protein
LSILSFPEPLRRGVESVGFVRLEHRGDLGRRQLRQALDRQPKRPSKGDEPPLGV